MLPDFIEVIGEYEDGESLDVLLRVSQILAVRPHWMNPAGHTLIVLIGDAGPVKALEPYEQVLKKIGFKR